MSTAKEELSQLIDSLEEDDAKAVRDFVKILLAEPDEVSEDEWKEIRKGEQEIERGDWVSWDDIKRTVSPSISKTAL